ncbi:MAG: sulfotransferase family protein [Maioricimonas sp. JB049]
MKSSSQGLLTLWHGMDVSTAFRLLKKRPPMHISQISRLAMMGPTSLYNSAMGGMERLIYGRQVAGTELELSPIFVIGHWRSGTTLLHNLITRDPQFTFPNLYQCLFPGHFLLTESVVSRLTRRLVPSSRPMDNVKCAWDTPQEDEIALCVMSLVSPYLMLAFQRDPSAYNRYFDLAGATEAERTEWKQALMTLMQKVTVRDNRRLVMKSPSHTFRVPLLLEMFPKARFVYIYRNPLRVILSGVHLRKTIFRENALARPMEDGYEDDVIDTYEDCIRTYERDKQLVPEGQLHEIRFEDLEADPLGELATTYDALRLAGFDRVRRILEPEMAELRAYRKNRFAVDAEMAENVYERLRFAFDLYDYPSPVEDDQQQAA